MYNILKNYQNIFQSVCTIPTSNIRGFQCFYILLSTCYCLFDYSYPGGYEVVSHCGFDLHFLNDLWGWASFYVLICNLSILYGEEWKLVKDVRDESSNFNINKENPLGALSSSKRTCLLHAAGFPSGSDSKGSACNAGDLGLIPGLGRFPGEATGNPLQYSCLENSIDRGSWWSMESHWEINTLQDPVRKVEEGENYCAGRAKPS